MERLFRIRNNRHYFYTGQLPGGQQIMMGIQLPEILAVYFDKAGRFQKFESRRLQGTLSSHDDSGALAQLRAWQKELHFAAGPIRVKKFFDTQRWVGIRELPEHYEEVIEHPERFESSRLEQLQADIQEWRARGDFVLYWSENYYLDKNGEVVSS